MLLYFKKLNLMLINFKWRLANVLFTLTPTVDTYEISNFTVQYRFIHIYSYSFVTGLRVTGKKKQNTLGPWRCQKTSYYSAASSFKKHVFLAGDETSVQHSASTNY